MNDTKRIEYVKKNMVSKVGHRPGANCKSCFQKIKFDEPCIKVSSTNGYGVVCKPCVITAAEVLECMDD